METKNDLYCLDDNQIVIYMEQLSLCKFKHFIDSSKGLGNRLCLCKPSTNNNVN